MKSFSLVIMCLVCSCLSSVAQKDSVHVSSKPVKVPETWSLILKAGRLNKGSANTYVESWGKGSTNASSLIKIDVDDILSPAFSLGLSFAYAYFGYGNSKLQTKYLSFNGTVKQRFTLADKMQVRPGFEIGYTNLEYNYLKGVGHGLKLALQVEITKEILKGVALVVETGFMSHPLGDIDDGPFLITPPVFYVTAGFEVFN